jgi:hypothetical protein
LAGTPSISLLSSSATRVRQRLLDCYAEAAVQAVRALLARGCEDLRSTRIRTVQWNAVSRHALTGHMGSINDLLRSFGERCGICMRIETALCHRLRQRVG